MNLSQQQIEHLFTFVKRKYVPYYDLQIELVDHLATSIEQKMAKDASMSFESALQKTYKGFGITGFAEYRSSKEKELFMFWVKRFAGYIWRFITPPKVVMTIALSICFYYFNVLILPLIGPFVACALIAIWMIVLFKLQFSQLFFQKRMKSKKLLTVSSYLSIIPSSLYIFSYMTFIGIKYIATIEDPSMFNLVFTSILASVTMMSAYALLVVFPKELESEVLSQYPEIFVD